jgi:ADP-heptose:LPS heptosyltransferase
MGDTLWGTPALRAIKRTFPASYLAILTSPIGKRILAKNPYLDGVYTVRDPAFFDCLCLLRRLRRERFDYVFVFHVTQRPVWPLVRLTGAARIIGLRGENKGLDLLLTETIAAAPGRHAVDKRLDAIAAIGAHVDRPRVEVHLGPDDRAAARAFLRSRDVGEDTPLVGIQPGANHHSRRWPAERFAEVARKLARHDPRLRIIVFGSPDETVLVHCVAGSANAIPLTAELDLLGAAAVIERCHVFVTNDTGPMHIASALNVPIVALFGAGNLAARPYNSGPSVLLTDPRGLDAIRPDDVASAAINELSKVR